VRAAQAFCELDLKTLKPKDNEMFRNAQSGHTLIAAISGAALSSFALLAMTGGEAMAKPLAAFDVAEDHTRIFMAAEPVHENGMPAHGNAFVSQGYIYPAGTLADGAVGVLEDGRPAFPDLVGREERRAPTRRLGGLRAAAG
jgi:hypothetical protein